jgi:hypothetical protein
MNQLIERQEQFNGFYRGIVISHDDPEVKGRCKIWVPGVYPKKYRNNAPALPFAEPAMPIFGGSFTNRDGCQEEETGITSPPHVGANLWVFFEGGDQNFPVYCFAIQGGDGWHSEHTNQHVIKTDNVRIRIDENPELPESTTKFDSFNENNTFLSQPQGVKQIPTRLDIEVTGPTNIVLNSNCEIDPDSPAFNLQINGTVFQEINGDKHETLIGNHYIKHVGDTHHVHEGNTLIERKGNVQYSLQGDYDIVQRGNKSNHIEGNNTHYVSGMENITVLTSQTQNITNRTLVVMAINSVNVNGVNAKNVTGADTETIGGIKNLVVGAVGNMYVYGPFNLTSQSSITEIAPRISMN